METLTFLISRSLWRQPSYFVVANLAKFHAWKRRRFQDKWEVMAPESLGS